MLLKYHCACCDQKVTQTAKVCPQCGSHHIKSPYGSWLFCIMGCLAVVMVFKSLHFYVEQADTDAPAQKSILDVLNADNKKVDQL